MKCRDLMLTQIFRCRETDSAVHCATLMRDAQLGMVVVVDALDRVVGLVTDRDLVMRVLAANRPYTTPLSEVMTGGPLVTFDPEEEVSALEQRMAEAHKSRAIAVDERGRCAGVISLSDLAQVEESMRTGRLVQQVTSREKHAAQF